MTTRLAQAAMGLITLAAAALIWLSASPHGLAPTLDGRPLVSSPAASPAGR